MLFGALLLGRGLGVGSGVRSILLVAGGVLRESPVGRGTLHRVVVGVAASAHLLKVDVVRSASSGIAGMTTASGSEAGISSTKSSVPSTASIFSSVL